MCLFRVYYMRKYTNMFLRNSMCCVRYLWNNTSQFFILSVCLGIEVTFACWCMYFNLCFHSITIIAFRKLTNLITFTFFSLFWLMACGKHEGSLWLLWLLLIVLVEEDRDKWQQCWWFLCIWFLLQQFAELLFLFMGTSALYECV